MPMLDQFQLSAFRNLRYAAVKEHRLDLQNGSYPRQRPENSGCIPKTCRNQRHGSAWQIHAMISSITMPLNDRRRARAQDQNMRRSPHLGNFHDSRGNVALERETTAQKGLRIERFGPWSLYRVFGLVSFND